jgi:hypothetical protein
MSSDINIGDVDARLKALESQLKQVVEEREAISDPVIKGLGIKFSDLDASKAGSVIHLHNALIKRVEELTEQVKALEAKAK